MASTERGNVQLRGSKTSLIARADQFVTGLPPVSGTTESALKLDFSIEGSDLPSDLPKTVSPQYISMTRDAPSTGLSSLMINQPYGYIGQTYVQPIEISGTGGTGGAVVYYYKMRGYYVTGAVWETWVNLGSPGTPPSGHTLIDTVIVSKWTV